MGGYLDLPVQPRNSEFHARRWNIRSGGSASTNTGRSDPPPRETIRGLEDWKMQPAGSDRQSWTSRLSAVILLALFLSLQVLPLVFSRTPDEPSIPDCCRTHGKHHCAMRMHLLAPSRNSHNSPAIAQLTEKCPYTPAAPASLHRHSFRPTLCSLIFAEVVSHPDRSSCLQQR